jgi:hypothetical protein
MICPKTFRYCGDDLCQSSCLQTGDSPLVPCEGCGGLISQDGGDIDECKCEPSYDDDDGRYDDGRYDE